MSRPTRVATELSTGCGQSRKAQVETVTMTNLLSPTKASILLYVLENPGCTRRAAAIGSAHSVNPSLVRDRRRIIALLLEEGLLIDRARKDPHYSRLYLSARARRLLKDV